MAISDQPEDQFQLREYLGIIRYRKWSLILVTGVVFVTGLALSLRQPPIYASRARVLVKPIQTASQFTFNFAQAINMDTEREIVRSEGVAALASEAVPGSTPAELLAGLAIDTPTNTAIIEITINDASPIRAQEAANAFANAYLTYKRDQATRTIEAQIEPLQARLDTLQKQLRELNRAIGINPPTAEQQSRRDELTSQIAVVQSQLAPVQGVIVDPGEIIQSAGLPSGPSSPNHRTNAILALFAGGMLGIVTALVRERLDDGLRGRADLEQQSGAPVLAVIPKLPAWKKRDEIRLTTVAEPKAAASEAYRTLRTSMLFAAAQRGIKTVMVASASAGEGKTTTAANLAVVLANADKRVILVNADLRKPRVHKFFQIDNRVGVVDVLAGDVKPWEALIDPGIENLRVFPSGPIPTRPAELLGSEAMGELLFELRQVADFIIIDSAPVLVVSDALALAPLVDGVIFVSDAGTTTRGAVAHAREQLEQVGADLVGSVLNNFDALKARSAPYYYRYYYRYKYRYGYQYGTPYGLPAEREEEGPQRRRRSSI